MPTLKLKGRRVDGFIAFGTPLVTTDSSPWGPLSFHVTRSFYVPYSMILNAAITIQALWPITTHPACTLLDLDLDKLHHDLQPSDPINIHCNFFAEIGYLMAMEPDKTHTMFCITLIWKNLLNEPYILVKMWYFKNWNNTVWLSEPMSLQGH